MRRSIAFALSFSIAGLSVAAVQTPAAADAMSSDAQHVTTVTVVLDAPHPARLAVLALAHGLSRAQRVRELAALVPSAATRRSVATGLENEGLTVTGSTAWSITATGPATTIAMRFGTRPKAGSDPSAVQLQAATSALPSVPAALRTSVSAVFPTTAGPTVAHHAATSALDGTDFRDAYTAAGDDASSGQNDADTTIATVQFADFRDGSTSNSTTSTEAADLTSYAEEHDLTDPVADGQYAAVRVDGGPSSTDDSLAKTVITVAAVGGDTVYHASSGSFHFTSKPGRTYTLTVEPTDLAGTSASGTATVVTPIDDRSFGLSKGWTRVTSSSHFGGSHIEGTAATLSASVTASGRTFSVRVPTGPSRGRLGVYRSRKKIATVDEYATKAGHELVRVLTSTTVTKPTLRFRPLATRSAASHGTKAGVDSLTVTR